MSRLGRLLVTVALVQKEQHEKHNQYCSDVEWRKQRLCNRLLHWCFDSNLTRHIDDWGYGVHLNKKRCFFHVNKTRCW